MTSRRPNEGAASIRGLPVPFGVVRDVDATYLLPASAVLWYVRPFAAVALR